MRRIGAEEEAAAAAWRERWQWGAAKGEAEAAAVAARGCRPRSLVGALRRWTTDPPGVVHEGVAPSPCSEKPQAAAAGMACWRPISWAPGAWASCAGARGGCSACRTRRSAAASPWGSEPIWIEERGEVDAVKAKARAQSCGPWVGWIGSSGAEEDERRKARESRGGRGDCARGESVGFKQMICRSGPRQAVLDESDRK